MRPNQILATLPKLKSAVCDPDFSITCAVSDQGVEVWLYGIVGDEYTKTDSLSIGQLLSTNKGKPLTMYVNSPGGLAYDGVAIFNAIQSHKGPTTGIIDGLAGSAASLAVMACDTVKAFETAKFHPHYSLCIAAGHKTEIADTLIMMEKLDTDLEKTYAARSGNSIETVKQHLTGPHGDGTHFTAAEAKAAGYVHEIISTNGRKANQAKPNNAVSPDRLRMWKRLLTSQH